MTTNTYDQIPYPSLVYTDTHPGRLATLATLFGLKPPPVATGRVLELGCGDGTNLIAIAQSLPQAECLGIDFSVQQIATGQQLVDTIQLPNITLKQLDFSKIDEPLGQFDYIIAHGVYSWVPKEQQDTVLNLCQRCLAPNGIAYISYNIYPGWHMENVVRDLMRYHTQQLAEVPFSVSMMQAKGIVRFIAHLRQPGKDAFDILLQEKSQQLQAMLDNYLYHDFLELENHPVYFHQFVEHARQHHLAYVTDIEFRHYLMLFFPPEVVEAMEELFQDDFFKKEQYMDFFYNRTLRRTLLCHQNLSVNRELDWKILPECYLATSLQLIDQNQESVQFQKTDGEDIFIKHPLMKNAILYLTDCYPQRVSFEKLFKQVSKKLPQKNQDLSALRETFAQELLHLYCLEAVELSIDPAPFTTTFGTHPMASPLACHLSSQGQQPIINLRCELVNLSPIAMALLPYLNGKNDRKTLLSQLKKLVEEGQIEPMKKDHLSSVLKQTLVEIARSALLVKPDK